MEIMLFADLEKTCLEAGHAFARALMALCIKDFDNEICASRDKKEYENLGFRKKTIKTIMGEVEIERRYYRHTDIETGEVRSVFLFDEKTEMNLVGRFTLSIADLCASLICEQSYRESAETIMRVTNQYMTAQGLWNVVQETAERIEETDAPASGKRTRVLFEETDGVYVKLRGEDRIESGRSAEMKIACFYEGHRQRDGRENEYECVNKKSVTAFASASDFYKKKEDIISTYYDTKQIDVRLINADGAKWARHFKTRSTAPITHMQLDPYHRNKAPIEAGLTSEEIRTVKNLLYNHQIPECIEYLKELQKDATGTVRYKRICALVEYYEQNEDIIIPIMDRGIKLPEPPKGIIYRGLGTMESTVGNVVALRMKKRKASWSKRGAENLSRLISYKRSGEISERILNADTAVIPKKHFDNAVDELKTLSAREVSDYVGRGYLPKQAVFDEGMMMTSVGKAIRAISKNNPDI